MVKITDVKYVGLKNTYNIEMKSDYHNYVIEGVVSKNSHSYAYSGLSYATAYLKANHPLEYMTALINANADDNDKLAKYIDESYRLGLDVKTPHINKSGMVFEHDPETKSILFGFNGIKGIGDASIQAIMLERANGPFSSFKDILTRMPSINKKTLESPIRGGALSTIEKYPYKYLPLLEFTQKAKQKSAYKKGDVTLYDGIVEEYIKSALTTDSTYSKLTSELSKIKGTKKEDKEKKEEINRQISELISKEAKKFDIYECKPSITTIKNDEQELLGFAISVNPKKALIKFSENIAYVSLAELKEKQDYYSDFVCMLTLKRISKTKNGSYFTTFADDTGEINTFLSRDRFNEMQDKLVTGSIFRVYCKLGKSNNPKYEDNLKVEYMRYFNVGIKGSLITLNCNIADKTLAQVLTKIKSDAILNESDINYRLEIKNGDRNIRLNIDYWINSIESITDLMIDNNITIGESDE